MTHSLRKSLLEVETAARKVRPERSKLNPASYIGGGKSSYEYLGLSVPQVRALYKNGNFSFLSGLGRKDVGLQTVSVWDYIWKHSKIYEVASLPLLFCTETIKSGSALLSHLPVLSQWVDRIDNWAHSDSLSSIYVRILEADHHALFPTLKQWSMDSNPWKRRQSIVSLLYYASARKKILSFPVLIKMVERQLSHEDYYVQKGVGWTLREIGNIYPDQAFSFLKKRIADIKPAAYSAATEKLNAKQKAEIKKLRAEAKVRNANR